MLIKLMDKAMQNLFFSFFFKRIVILLLLGRLLKETLIKTNYVILILKFLLLGILYIEKTPTENNYVILITPILFLISLIEKLDLEETPIEILI